MVIPRSSRLATVLLAVLTFAPLGPALAQPCAFLDPPDPSADLPDDGYVDANGDGIDGMRCGPIFVSPLGSDANLGTIESPMRTVGAAILAARAFTPPRDVYIGYVNDGGGGGPGAASSPLDYDGTVVLASGVDLYGGYDAGTNWARSFAARATIHLGDGSGDATLLGVGIDRPTVVDHLIIASDRGEEPGTTNIAVWLRDGAAGVAFRNCDFSSAPGVAGADGVDGAQGTSGGNGGTDPVGSQGGEPGAGSNGEQNRGGRGGGGAGDPFCVPPLVRVSATRARRDTVRKGERAASVCPLDPARPVGRGESALRAAMGRAASLSRHPVALASTEASAVGAVAEGVAASRTVVAVVVAAAAELVDAVVREAEPADRPTASS